MARVDHTIRDSDRVFGRFLSSGGPINDSPAYTVAGVDSFQRYQLNGFFNASGNLDSQFQRRRCSTKCGSLTTAENTSIRPAAPAPD